MTGQSPDAVFAAHIVSLIAAAHNLVEMGSLTETEAMEWVTKIAADLPSDFMQARKSWAEKAPVWTEF
jgi:hypothetical protein